MKKKMVFLILSWLLSEQQKGWKRTIKIKGIIHGGGGGGGDVCVYVCVL